MKRRTKAIVRATAVVSMVSTLVVGATFALAHTATLNNNTYTATSETDGLLLAKRRGNFAQTLRGFNFGNANVGDECTDYERLRMRNTDNDDFDVTVSGTYRDEPIDEREVFVKFLNDETGDKVRYSLYELQNSDELLGMPGVSRYDNSPNRNNELEARDTTQFRLCVELDEGALDPGESLEEGGTFDLVFTGTEVNDNDNDDDRNER